MTDKLFDGTWIVAFIGAEAAWLVWAIASSPRKTTTRRKDLLVNNLSPYVKVTTRPVEWLEPVGADPQRSLLLMKLTRRCRRHLLHRRHRTKSMRLDGKHRIELAAKILQRDDRRQLDEFIFAELPLESIEEAIRDTFVRVGHSLA